jgi:2-polyprenyl-3-methyl-5-hydroxy-6-metoxy-1,4-benzoquinol methylase
MNNTVEKCPVCSSRHLHYAFTLKAHRVVRCNECALMMLNPQPSDEVLESIYGSDYFVFSDNAQDRLHTDELKRSTANRYLDQFLSEDENLANKSLLEIGCGSGDFLVAAASKGLSVVGVEYSPYACQTTKQKLAGNDVKFEIIQGDISTVNEISHFGKYDYVVFCDVIEHVRDPQYFVKIVNKLLKPGGGFFCAVPSLDSWSAKLLKTNWMEFKLEHLFYFNTSNLKSLFFQGGFSDFSIIPSKKTLSIDYIAGHFDKHPVPIWSNVINMVRKVLPHAILRKPFPITASGIVLMGKKKEQSDKLVLSVVMPAFNEESTIGSGIERVLNKKLLDMDCELIIVESNSVDATREIVLKYADHPRVQIILESEPKGKGHAVRAGLKKATGDFILIQDADDEYDIEDYDALLEKLRDGSESFILGARHGGGGWKMREFTDQPFRAFVLNCGHWFFTFLLNILYGVWLRDPFTMYKVFRRDNLNHVTLECNRFDFDHELVIKFIKKGFKPIEIPVNYRSRSFAQGKKVRIFADPLTWIKAIFKYRFSKT